MDASILVCEHGSDCITFEDVVEGGIRELAVVNKTGNRSGHGLVLTNVGQFRFDHVRLSEFTGSGLVLDHAITNTFTHPFVTDNKGRNGGIWITGTSNNNTFLGGRIGTNLGPGLYITGPASMNTFIGTDFEANKNGGILVNSPNNASPLICRSCWVESNARAEAQVIVTGGAQRVVFEDTRFGAGDGFDFKVDNAVWTELRRSFMGPGIQITANATDTLIEQRGHYRLSDAGSRTVFAVVTGSAPGFESLTFPRLAPGYLCIDSSHQVVSRPTPCVP